MKDLLEAFPSARLWKYVDHRELEIILSGI